MPGRRCPSSTTRSTRLRRRTRCRRAIGRADTVASRWTANRFGSSTRASRCTVARAVSSRSILSSAGSGASAMPASSGLDLAQPAARDGVEQRVLRGEVAVDVGVRHAGFGRDGHDRHALGPEPREMLGGDPEQPDVRRDRCTGALGGRPRRASVAGRPRRAGSSEARPWRRATLPWTRQALAHGTEAEGGKWTGGRARRTPIIPAEASRRFALTLRLPSGSPFDLSGLRPLKNPYVSVCLEKATNFSRYHLRSEAVLPRPQGDEHRFGRRFPAA